MTPPHAATWPQAAQRTGEAASTDERQPSWDRHRHVHHPQTTRSSIALTCGDASPRSVFSENAGVAHFLTDADDPAGVVAALAPGSFVVISHLTADFAPGPRPPSRRVPVSLSHLIGACGPTRADARGRETTRPVRQALSVTKRTCTRTRTEPYACRRARGVRLRVHDGAHAALAPPYEGSAPASAQAHPKCQNHRS
jgi:hypothetical protein